MRTFISARRARAVRATAGLVVATAALAAAGTLDAGTAAASPATTTLFTESFRDAQTGQAAWALPSNGGGNSACLTASGDYSATPIRGCWETSRDAAGAGALHLTSSTYSAVGTAYYDAGLPSAQGLDVTFNSYQFGVNGGHAGDGISFILAATDPSNPSAPASIGPSGGSLGYTGTTAVGSGVPHGYLGFGLDTVGGFSNADSTNPSCAPATSVGAGVAVRGPGHGIDGYCVLGAAAAGQLDAPGSWSRPAPVPVEVVVNTTASTQVSRGGVSVPAGQWMVAWTAYGSSQQTLTGPLPTLADVQRAAVPAEWFDPTTNVPYQLSFGWAGSTGAWQENHEVSDVVATTLGGQLPLFDLAVDDDAAGQLVPGSTGTVTVTPTLEAAGGDEGRPVTVTTTMPAGLTPAAPTTSDYTCSATGQVVSCTTTSGPFSAGTALPALDIPVTATSDQLGTQQVSAKVSSTDGNPATALHPFSVKVPQDLSITSTPGATVAGATYQLAASGGASGNPVTWSIDATSSSGACSLAGDIVTFEHVGTCLVDAAQAGDDSHLAASAQQSVSVQAIASTTTATLSRSTSVHGEPVTATAQIVGATTGTVQFSVDGVALGAPVAVTAGGTATSPALTDAAGHALAVGSHHVDAAFTPGDATVYAGSAALQQVLVVTQASTTTDVSVHPGSLEATVAVTAPGTGTPSGSVRFSVDGTDVGTAALVDGVATLTRALPASRSHAVAATYLGDASFAASSGSTARQNPSITARITSAQARSRYGWYRSPVTVSFRCTTHGAALTAGCPAPVTIWQQGAGRSVTRTITAVDGGVATITVKGINLDRGAPSVRVAGIRSGARYFATALPLAKCHTSDAVSGVAGCWVRRTVRGSVETITATSLDRAGNVSRSAVRVHVDRFVVVAPSSRGVYLVQRNRTYTLLAVSATRPRFVDAALAPRRPRGEDAVFHRIGYHRWALGVTMAPNMARHTTWNLGIRADGGLHVLTVRVR